MKVDFLTGTNNLRKDREGNSDLLATFMALAQVDDSLRAVLGDMAPPKSMAVKNDTVDGFLRSLANAAVELLARLSLSRQKQSQTVQAELDRLSDSLTEVQGERAYMATVHKLGAVVNGFNDKAAAKLSSGTKTAVKAIQDTRGKVTNQKAKTALVIAEALTSLGDKDESTRTGESITKMMNDMPNGQALRSLWSDIRGATESNMGLLRLVNLVRARIDAVRQDYREGIPRELEKRFSRPLSREEWSQLFMGLGRADLMAFKRPEVMDLLKNPKAADRKIQDLEEKIQSLGGKFAPRYLEKAEALATYMMTRKVISDNLQRNAHSIARLAGEHA